MYPSNQSHVDACRCAVCRMVESNRNRRVFVREADRLIALNRDIVSTNTRSMHNPDECHPMDRNQRVV